MIIDVRCRRILAIAVGVVVLSLMPGGQVLETSAWGAPAEPGESTPAKAGDGDAENDKIREQSIYIPYEKLREIFEKEGRGVFLPYGEFEKLWRAAREGERPTVKPKPPVDALISEVENDATVSQDVMRVSARVKIEVLTAGWKEIPLRLADAAITKATLGDEAARIVFEPGAGYQLLVDKKNDEPELLELSLEYVKAFAKAPGQNSVAFQAPQAPVSRWRISIPESGVKVNVHPLIAASEVPDKGGVEKPSGQTVVLAFVGAAPTVRIEWTPKAEGAMGLEALASVQAQQQVIIEEGVTRTRTRLEYDISRAELSQLVVEVPADQKIVNVFDANVRQWSVEQVGDIQRITVQLFEPARKSQNVTVELEKFREDGAQQEVPVPVVKAMSVGRQQGLVLVEVAAGLRAEAIRHTGLLQVDAGELPEVAAKTKWTFSYRYAALPFDLSLQVEKVQPRIVADALVEAYLEPEQLRLNLLAVYNVERAGVFRLDIDIPTGFEVRRVYGKQAAGAQAAQVDTHYLEAEEKTRLVVNLSRKAFGKVALAVDLQKRLAEPDLLKPTGKTATIPLAIPRIAPTTVERASGRLIIYASESLRVNPSKVEGLRSVSFTEALEGIAPDQVDRPSGIRPVLAFSYAQEQVALELAVERRKPHVMVRQLLVARIEAGVVKYTATFKYDIRYSGVKSLRIDVPTDLAGEIRNQTAGVREKVLDPPPEDLAEGYVSWSLTGETEFIGSVTINLGWEHKIEELEVGKSIELTVPRLRPGDVDRAWGQIVLTKAETMDVREAGNPQGVRPIDPQHDLMDGVKVADAARAFEFHNDWSLSVEVTRYKLEEIKRTSIERALLRMVATRSDQISVQALYRMRSVRQRLAVKLAGDVEFDSEPLRINGRAVSLERGEKDDFFVPLVGLKADTSFLLELRYTVSGTGLRFQVPEFPSEPAVQKVYLCAYLPQELVYLGSIGPWTDELRWRLHPILDQRPLARRGGPDLLNWVQEGIDLSGSPGDTFPTDGRMYLFSALRPSGSLRLVAMDEDWLNVIIFVFVSLSGLALLRYRAEIRWLAVGAFFVTLVLAGVFFPTFSRQIIDGNLIAAVLIVLVVWFVQYRVRVRPKSPAVEVHKPVQEEQTEAGEPEEKKGDSETGGSNNA